MQGKKLANQRSCKHISEVRGAAAEQERLTSAASGGDGGAGFVGGPSKKNPPRLAAPSGLAGAIEGKAPPALLLANKWEEKLDPTGWWISEKLDGMRAYWDPDRGCLLSRPGNPILCPKPLLESLPKIPLDGELFLGRGRFQDLMSVVKNSANIDKIDGPWKDVVYIVFDLPKHGGKFEERMEALRTQLGAGLTFARCHEQWLCKGHGHLDEELKRVQAQDGEGLMLRRAGSLYEAGRSNSLLKVKTFQDEEAVVIGYEAGKGRNAEVTGALKCRNRAGIRFSVGSGLNDAQRANPPKVGEIITYRFFELTKDNKPRFPSFVGVRADADRKGLEL
jgi:DNA ligase-1